MYVCVGACVHAYVHAYLSICIYFFNNHLCKCFYLSEWNLHFLNFCLISLEYRYIRKKNVVLRIFLVEPLTPRPDY